MSAWRKLRTALQVKSSEWAAAAEAKAEKEREARRQAEARRRERLQPVIDKVDEYLEDVAHWEPELDSFHWAPHVYANVPAEVLEGVTQDDRWFLLSCLESGVQYEFRGANGDTLHVSMSLQDRAVITVVPLAPAETDGDK